VVEEEQPSQVLVTTWTREQDVILLEPKVSDGRLVGEAVEFSWATSSYVAADTTPVLSIPLEDISQVKVRKVDAGKTVGLFAALAVGALLIVKIVGGITAPPCRPSWWTICGSRSR
jgi:hypothetical protein